MCCSVLAPGFLCNMCSVNVLLVYYCVVTDYNLWRALQAHNNNCYRFCECVLCMCMLWGEVEHAVGHVPGVVCVCVCVCVCLGGGEESEFGNKCEKGKGKEGERRLSASVMNSPLPFVQG